VSKWVTSAQPAAELTPQGEEILDESTGNKVQHFVTKNGVRFARVVEPTGFILWLQEVP
jgi:hypothetical protein